MVYYFALSIFLFPIVTVLGSQFWNDVDSLNNELSDPQNNLTEPTPPAPQHSPSPLEMEVRRLKRLELLNRKFFRKNITVSAIDIETFKQTIVIDKSYPQNLSLAEIENKLLALGRFQEWFDIDTYGIEIYPKYWAKVCLSLRGKPLVRNHKYCCALSPSYAINMKKILQIGEKNLYLDLLSCNCYNYESNCRFPESDPETFLIHKSGENEFYVFENINSTKDSRCYLNIRNFQAGIILPNPLDEDQVGNKASKSLEKFVTLRADDIAVFNRSLTIIKSYPENITLAQLEYKLLQFREIHEWPELHSYNVKVYFMYWANLCVTLWGKQLNRIHGQACVISTSYGTSMTRKLFIKGRALHFDLLLCKCHSYKSNFRQPISGIDIFLIHRSSAKDFFVFEQLETGNRSFTLFIKNYKQMTNLPDIQAIK